MHVRRTSRQRRTPLPLLLSPSSSLNWTAYPTLLVYSIIAPLPSPSLAFTMSWGKRSSNPSAVGERACISQGQQAASTRNQGISSHLASVCLEHSLINVLIGSSSASSNPSVNRGDQSLHEGQSASADRRASTVRRGTCTCSSLLCITYVLFR